MDEYLLYGILACIITLIIGVLTYLRGRTSESQQNERPEEVEGAEGGARTRVRTPTETPAGAGGLRNRAVANRNARARMRAAQMQRQQTHSDTEDEIEELGEEIALPDEKIGKKKLAKLQMKAEKRAMREAEEREREEKKEREEQKAEARRQLEKEREEEEARKEEEERLRKEEEERREQEEYERMKAEFLVEEEGYEEDEDEEKHKSLLQEFVQYIKNNKVVVLEDLAALFKLKTQAVIDRIAQLQEDKILTGVIDDRGKFIYISQSELESVAKFIRQSGRVSLSDLAEASNTLINLNPETSVKA
ncbi:UNVERIFIED_CONTAM: hypothetical protein RMT77_018486 [Armadillidium vulgare]